MQLCDDILYDVDLKFRVVELAFGLLLDKGFEVEEVLPDASVDHILQPGG